MASQPPPSQVAGATASTAPRRVEDAAAMAEHRRTLHWRSTLDEIKAEAGRGVYMYFHYVRYLIMVSAVLSVPGTVTYLFASETILDEYQGVSKLFTGAYSQDFVSLWRVGVVIICVLALLVGPFFQWFHAQQVSWRGEDREEEVVRGHDVILENRHVTSRSRSMRRTLSLLVFAGILALQTVAIYGIHKAYEDDINDSIVAFIVAIYLNGTHFVWAYLGRMLTKFERHKTITLYREWDTGKLFFLRVANLVSTFVVKSEVLKEANYELDCQTSTEADCNCPLKAMGYQFFFFIVVDLTIGTCVEVAAPWARIKLMRLLGKGKNVGDDRIMPEFDIASEYAEVMYRQLIVLLGFPVFQLLPVLGLVSYLVEFYSDRYRLAYLCRKASVKAEPMNPRLVLYCSVFVALCAIFTYPQGALWILQEDNVENCNFFRCYVDATCD